MRPPGRVYRFAFSVVISLRLKICAGATWPAPATPKECPWGGDLESAPKGSTPNFMIWALRDPEGANLDRIQVIKGWVDAKDKPHEQVYDVAWSGDRKAAADGKLPPVGDTVDPVCADLVQ